MDFKDPSEHSTEHPFKLRILIVLTAIALLTIISVTAIGISDSSDAQKIDYNIGALTETDVVATYDTETFAITVTGTGAMKDFANIDKVPWHNYADQIKTVSIGGKVSSIGSNAFNGCTSLTRVTVLNMTAPSLRSDSFSNCTSLCEILVPSGSAESYKSAEVWSSYSAIIFTDISTCTVEDIKDIPWTGMSIEPAVTVKDGDITLIEDTHYTLSYGKNIDIGIGTVNITGIGDYRGIFIKTFYIVEMWDVSASGSDDVAVMYNHNTDTLTLSGTGAMKDYTSQGYPPWISAYKDRIKTIIIEDGVTYIGAYAFRDCIKAVSLTAGKGLDTIGSNAFHNCTSLSSAILSEGVTTIRDNAFSQCSSLTSFTIPSTVITIESNAFEKTGLTSVDIPAKTKFIGPCAFAVSTLNQITVSDDNAKYCSDDGVLFSKYKTSIECYPAGRTANNYSVPDSVMSVQMSAFRYCAYIESVTVSDKVDALPSSVFYQCTSLRSVILQGNVEYIDDDAFADCTSLVSVTIANKTVPSLKDNSFTNCSALREILVPSKSVDSYRTAAVWSAYASKISAGITLCTVDDITDQIFSGSQITPSVVVRDEGVILIEGTHYTVSYGKNTDAGEGTVTITGIGDYAGSVTETFNIVQDERSGAIIGVWSLAAVLLLILVCALIYAGMKKEHK